MYRYVDSDYQDISINLMWFATSHIHKLHAL